MLNSRLWHARTHTSRAGEAAWLLAALLVFGIQRLAVTNLGQGGTSADIRRSVFFVTTALVVVVALHFRRYVGAWLIAAGVLLNFIPMASHGGLMPVAWELIDESGAFPQVTAADIGHQVPNSKDIVLARDDIRFEPLSDRYVITLPLYGANIYSAGDFVAFAGVALAAAQIVLLVFVGGATAAKPGAQPGEAQDAT